MDTIAASATSSISRARPTSIDRIRRQQAANSPVLDADQRANERDNLSLEQRRGMMSVIETLAYQRPPRGRAEELREPIDDAEAVLDSLSVEARNELRVLDDQLSAVIACTKELAHDWFASMDRMALNGFEFLRNLARVETPEELVRLQTKLMQDQMAAFGECCDQYRRQIVTAINQCAHER
jgi:hypothetical protein